MKRMIPLILAILLAITPALAEIDLSSMTLDELIELHEQVQLALFEQAKSVTVPQGTWLVGKDIPAGTYLLRCADMGNTDSSLRLCYVRWGTKMPNSYGSFPDKSEIGNVILYNPNSSHYEEGQIEEYVVTFEEGWYVFISSNNNRAVFSQYTGTPSFTFDW